MSEHSTTAAHHPAGSAPFAPTPLPGYDSAVPPAFPRHVVTAVLVAHDGARWLPDALAGLLGQERPVQGAVGADTASTDDSARLLAEALGDDRVLHLARRTGFGAAVDEAVRSVPAPDPETLPYLRRSSGWDPVSRTWRDDPDDPHGYDRGGRTGQGRGDLEPVQWLWLLHDDCAPEPGALHELLRAADAEPDAAVIGPKLRSWYDRRQLLEVGVSIARSGRRWTGLERREQDQGQHDQVRSVLSVSTAGMLIRRDVYERLGGFDSRLPLMRDDVDLCWRAHAAGHRVLVAPDAVARHAEAAARERRPVDCAGRTAADPHRVDKAGAVHTLLANTHAKLLPYVLVRLVLGTLLRALGYLLGKAPGQALDELTGLFGTLLRPGRLRAARKRRGRPAVPPGELRPLFPPVGATVRATVEGLASGLGRRPDTESSSAGRHGAVESGPGGEDADFLEIEQFGRLKRIARKPGPVLFAVLLLVSLIACRALLGGGSLSGGALLPAPDGVSGLWSRYADAWHPVGTGTTGAAPPYLAVLAGLSALFLGSTGFTLTLLLVCSVPLAGLTAYFSSRTLVSSRLLRAWASVAYAFLPAATGALATGRLGTAVLAVLLPPMARTAVASAGLRTPGARPTWRATWAYALLLTVTTAFTPVVWPLAVVLGLGAVAWSLTRGGGRPAVHGIRFLTAVATPLVVLAPWSFGLLAHPGRFLTEAGIEPAAVTSAPWHLLTGDPGGPKTFGGLLFTGVVLAALAALLRADRRRAILTAWATALAALLCAVLTRGGSGWAGPATLVYGLALVAASVVGAEGARERVAALSFGWRQPVAALVAVTAIAAPLAAAVAWAAGGADGPLKRGAAAQVPAFVAEEAATRDQARTLVLGGEAGHVAYALVRGSGAELGDAELAASAGHDKKLDATVAGLVAGSGADQASALADYAVGYVIVRGSAPGSTGRTLDTTTGLTRLSRQGDSSLWRVDRDVARVTVVGGRAGARPVPVAAGPVEAHDTLPAGDEGRVLRVADKADPGWQATLDGRTLKPTTVDGWAQGFTLPAGGGRLALVYRTPLPHTAWAWTQGLLAVVLVVLALPGRRREVDDDLPEATAVAPGTPAASGSPAPVPSQPGSGEGRRARRLRAAAEADGGPAAPAAPEPPVAEPLADPYGPYGQQSADPYAAVPHQQPYGQQEPGGWGADQAGHQGHYAGQGHQEAPYEGDGGVHRTAYGNGYGSPYDGAHHPPQGQETAGYPQPDPYQGGQQADPYAAGSYDPYNYGGQPYDTTYGGGHQPHRDGSEQQ
ncbi:family 2 glycosyl transferase [Streptomyces eurocidicus]|uniref:Family 2 glycosyl transferase n=1 Tax=Streptomyces eurocidicus TaxID=66423 RepID=A0A2N8NM42_STREU|nr:glycosyltransferase [Streptomyces eurocidicus]MBB5123015.1 GT2 family glycosyltransferase [Streptomyces eurocidicus]MBF6054878.1 glycosyltransferase [Streptomyces eurocidicus]PNE29817.1 family 2 glycosyl transferase [Streptomyces eurocidicus]